MKAPKIQKGYFSFSEQFQKSYRTVPGGIRGALAGQSTVSCLRLGLVAIHNQHLKVVYIYILVACIP